MLEGKTFAEGFLQTIMEVPIKDRDAKIEKVLGIISDIEDRLKSLNKYLPPQKLKEETKKGMMAQDFNHKSNIDDLNTQASSNNMQSRDTKQVTEIKGILKKDRFSTQ
jgi:hypothetical protein